MSEDAANEVLKGPGKRYQKPDLRKLKEEEVAVKTTAELEIERWKKRAEGDSSLEVASNAHFLIVLHRDGKVGAGVTARGELAAMAAAREKMVTSFPQLAGDNRLRVMHLYSGEGYKREVVDKADTIGGPKLLGGESPYAGSDGVFAGSYERPSVFRERVVERGGGVLVGHATTDRSTQIHEMLGHGLIAVAVNEDSDLPTFVSEGLARLSEEVCVGRDVDREFATGLVASALALGLDRLDAKDLDYLRSAGFSGVNSPERSRIRLSDVWNMLRIGKKSGYWELRNAFTIAGDGYAVEENPENVTASPQGLDMYYYGKYGSLMDLTMELVGRENLIPFLNDYISQAGPDWKNFSDFLVKRTGVSQGEIRRRWGKKVMEVVAAVGADEFNNYIVELGETIDGERLDRLRERLRGFVDLGGSKIKST